MNARCTRVAVPPLNSSKKVGRGAADCFGRVEFRAFKLERTQ